MLHIEQFASSNIGFRRLPFNRSVSKILHATQFAVMGRMMGKLAQCCYPGALTLGILSSLRAETTFSVVKSMLTKTASLSALLQGMMSVEEKLKAIQVS